MKRNIIFIALLISLALNAVSATAKKKKVEYEKVAISIATLNAEFLSTHKVHMKHRFDHNGKELRYPFWLVPGVSDRDSLLQLALTAGRAKSFFSNFDTIPSFNEAVLNWGNDNYRAEKLRESSKEVAKLIKDLDADLLVLTEVGDDGDLAVLKDELSKLGLDYPNHFICKCSDKQTHQTVALLSRFPIIEAEQSVVGREGYFEESDDVESERDTGLSKGFRALVNVNGEYVFIYGAHFKSERGASEADGKRIAQASIVRRDYLPLLSACITDDKGKVSLTRESLRGTCPQGAKRPHVIVAGDLNEKRGQPALARVRGLDDIGVDLIQTGALNYFPRSESSSRWTYEYQGIKNQIDHILISPSMLSIGDRGKTKISSLTIDHGNHKATDHNPLKVSLEYERVKK